jgi:hypothetical protein
LSLQDKQRPVRMPQPDATIEIVLLR